MLDDFKQELEKTINVYDGIENIDPAKLKKLIKMKAILQFISKEEYKQMSQNIIEIMWPASGFDIEKFITEFKELDVVTNEASIK